MKTFKLFPIFLIFASMLFAVPMLAPGAEPSFMGRTGASKSREETTNGRFPPPGPHLERRKAPAQASGGGFGSSQSTKARIKPKDKDTKNTALGNLIGRLTRLAEKKQKDGGKLILADLPDFEQQSINTSLASAGITVEGLQTEIENANTRAEAVAEVARLKSKLAATQNNAEEVEKLKRELADSERQRSEDVSKMFGLTEQYSSQTASDKEKLQQFESEASRLKQQQTETEQAKAGQERKVTVATLLSRGATKGKADEATKLETELADMRQAQTEATEESARLQTKAAEELETQRTQLTEETTKKIQDVEEKFRLAKEETKRLTEKFSEEKSKTQQTQSEEIEKLKAQIAKQEEKTRTAQAATDEQTRLTQDAGGKAKGLEGDLVKQRARTAGTMFSKVLEKNRSVVLEKQKTALEEESTKLRQQLDVSKNLSTEETEKLRAQLTSVESDLDEQKNRASAAEEETQRLRSEADEQAKRPLPTPIEAEVAKIVMPPATPTPPKPAFNFNEFIKKNNIADPRSNKYSDTDVDAAHKQMKARSKGLGDAIAEQEKVFRNALLDKESALAEIIKTPNAKPAEIELAQQQVGKAREAANEFTADGDAAMRSFADNQTKVMRGEYKVIDNDDGTKTVIATGFEGKLQLAKAQKAAAAEELGKATTPEQVKNAKNALKQAAKDEKLYTKKARKHARKEDELKAKAKKKFVKDQKKKIKQEISELEKGKTWKSIKNTVDIETTSDGKVRTAKQRVVDIGNATRDAKVRVLKSRLAVLKGESAKLEVDAPSFTTKVKKAVGGIVDSFAKSASTGFGALQPKTVAVDTSGAPKKGFLSKAKDGLERIFLGAGAPGTKTTGPGKVDINASTKQIEASLEKFKRTYKEPLDKMNADSDQAVADNADSVETIKAQPKEEPNDSEKLKGFLKKAEEAVTEASMNKGAESKGIEVATVKFLTEQADQVRVALDAEVGALEIQIKSANKKNKPKLETELTNTKLKINKFNTDQVELKKKTLKALRGEEQERIKGSKAKVEAERQAVDAEKFDLASAKEKSKAGSTPSDETLKAEFEKEKAKKLASLEIQDKNLDEYSAGVTGRETSLDAELNDKTKLLEAEAAKLKNTANTDPATKSVGAAPGASANIQTPKKPAAGVGTKVKERFVKAKNKFKGLFSRKKKAATADSNDAEGTEEKVVGNNVEVEVAEPVGAAAPAKSIKKEIKTIKSATDKQIKTLMAETSGKELEDAIKKYVDDQTEKVRTTLNAEVAELEEQAGKATSQDDLGKLNKKLKTARSNLDDFDGKQKTLKLEAVEAVAAEEKAAIKKQKSDIEKQIKKLETEKTEASKIKGTAAGEAKAQQIMLDAENKIASLKGQSGTLDREVEAIDKRVAASKETIDTEAGALKQQETEKAQKRKTETDEAIKVATSTVGGVAADTEETSSALEKLRKKVSGAGAEVQKSAEKKIKQAAENFEASEKAVTKLKADIENAGSDVKKVATLSKQLEAETTKRNKLAGQLSDLEAETAKNSVSAVKKAAEQEQADIQKQISELEKTKAKTLAGSGLDDLVNQKSKQLADQEDIGNKQKISSLQEKLKGLGAIVNNADGISKNMNLSPLERLAAATADTEATRFGSATGTKKIGGSSSATSMEALKRAALAPEIEQRKERVKQVSALRKRTAQLSTATQESVGKITAAATIKRAWKKHRGPVGIEEITKTRRSARNVIDDATGQIRRTKSFSSGSTGNDSDGPIRRTRSFSGTAKDRVRLGGAANETARPMRGPDIERVRK